MRNNKGETIAETLVAVLISAVCFVGLQTSIVAAARINKQAENQIKTFKVENSTSVRNGKVEITRGSGSVTTPVTGISIYYSKDNSYYYYKTN